MAKSWLVDGRAIARKVKASSQPSAHQIKDCGANRECPRCRFRIDNRDVAAEWPGLPVGVKFDPLDVEIMQHLAAKGGAADGEPHPFIDEFIPTLDEEDGICYKHPENLPGARKDGSSVHFFYRSRNAYATGHRKRRKIHDEESASVRWHKTGKTKAVVHNGAQIGCKKIMVLYGTAVGSKPCRLNWVMHQYHLGADEDEKEGEYVVSKVFYQPEKLAEKADGGVVVDVADGCMSRTGPRTPKTDAPEPPRPGKCGSYGDGSGDRDLQSPAEESGRSERKSPPSPSNTRHTEAAVWEDESQAVDLDAFDDSLFCDENLDAWAPFGGSSPHRGPVSGSSHHANDAPGTVGGPGSWTTDLNNFDLGTPPDFNLADLQFSSQDSIFGWLDRL